MYIKITFFLVKKLKIIFDISWKNQLINNNTEFPVDIIREQSKGQVVFYVLHVWILMKYSLTVALSSFTFHCDHFK